MPCALLGAVVLCLALSPSALAQEFIVHSSAFSEDGNAKYDADGAKNGVVLWKSGTVHVTSGTYPVGRNHTLIIEPGAIVKIAGGFVVDANNRLISWQAPDFGGGIVSEGGPIQIDGVTLTDIRDDSVGGDTNQDGAGSSVPASGVSPWYLRFSGSDQDYLKNSTIKHCTKIGHIGSMNITGNKFLQFAYLLSIANTGPVVLNAVPVITQNTFELVTLFGLIDLRGMSPVFDDNTVKGGDGITIGPWFENIGGSETGNPVGPSTGTTIISNNRIERGNYGVRIYTVPSDTLYTKTRFRAEVRGNTIQGPSSGTALELALDAEATVSDNQVSGYAYPLRFIDNNKTETSRLNVQFNRFTLDGVSSSYSAFSQTRLWQNGHIVKAENNFWGDPSGPFDNSNADGRTNPRGKGLKVGDGIDYVPFTGGSPPPLRDTVRIIVSPSAAPPFNPGATITFNVTSDLYDLKSAPTGKLVLLVRDSDGVVINQPEIIVTVNSQSHTATFPPVSVQVPGLASAVTVEAGIVPDGGGESGRSNIERFTVNKPTSNFTITGISEVPSGNTPNFIRGNKTRTKIAFNYTLSGPADGLFEIVLKEVVKDSAIIVREIKNVPLIAPPGPIKTAEAEFEVEIPLRDVLKTRPGEILIEVTLKDGSGTSVGKLNRILPIDENANQIRFGRLVPAEVVNGNITAVAKSHFVVGDQPGYAYSVFYRIGTQNVTSWQVRVGEDEALDAKGKALHEYQVTSAAAENVTTGPERELRQALNSSTPLPAGTRKYRARALLYTPGNIVVAVATYDVEVRDAVQLLSRVVPAGASQIAFSPIPITVKFASNQTAGNATAEEFAGQFGAPAATAASLAALGRSRALLSQTTNSNITMIPLKRYWSVYGDLQEGKFSATVSFTYNPATDFPAVAGFSEDALVVAGLNPLSNDLEALPSTLDKTAHTVTTAYTTFFDTYVVVAKVSAAPRLPNLTLTLGSSISTLLLRVSAEVGTRLDLEETPSLTPATWITTTSLTVTNDPQTVTLPLPTLSPRFYRARLQ